MGIANIKSSRESVKRKEKCLKLLKTYKSLVAQTKIYSHSVDTNSLFRNEIFMTFQESVMLFFENSEPDGIMLKQCLSL